RAVVGASRAIGTALRSGIGKVDEGEQKAFPTLKPLAAFTQVAQWMHDAAIDGIWSSFEDMAGRAVEHFESPKGAADLADPKFQFSPRELGYSKGVFG